MKVAVCPFSGRYGLGLVLPEKEIRVCVQVRIILPSEGSGDVARSDGVGFYLCFCRPSATMSLSLSLPPLPLPLRLRLRLRLPPECFASVASPIVLTSMARHTFTSTSTLCIYMSCRIPRRHVQRDVRDKTSGGCICDGEARMPSARPF